MNIRCEMEEADWDSLALGCLEPEQANPLLAHLRTGCPACHQAYAEARAACLTLGVGLAGQAPSQVVEDRLAAYVGKSQKVLRMPQPAWQRWTPWAAAAACLLFAIWTKSNVPPAQHPQQVRVDRQVLDPNPQLQQRISELEAELKRKPIPEAAIQTVLQPVPDPRVPELTAKLAEAERKLAQPQPVPTPVAERNNDQQLLALQSQIRNLEMQLAATETSHRAELERRDRKSTQLASRLEALQRQIDSQHRMLADYRNAFRTIESNGMRQVDMAVVDPAAGHSSARALFSRDGGLLVVANDLPRLPSQHCYQLWILRKGNPSIVSGGLLKLDERGRGYLQTAPSAALQGATGFAITDEPEGGSVVARGRKLLFGAL